MLVLYYFLNLRVFHKAFKERYIGKIGLAEVGGSDLIGIFTRCGFKAYV